MSKSLEDLDYIKIYRGYLKIFRDKVSLGESGSAIVKKKKKKKKKRNKQANKHQKNLDFHPSSGLSVTSIERLILIDRMTHSGFERMPSLVKLRVLVVFPAMLWLST